MPGDVDIAFVASLLADPTRVGMLMALGDGRALTAGELARHMRVAPSTASAHLSKLEEAGLLVGEKQGRHRYFRLADPTVVQVLESLAVFAPVKAVRSLRDSTIATAVRSARMCYNHLAGEFGVALAQALVEKQILELLPDGYLVSDCGERWLQELGVDCRGLKKQGKLFAPHHIDWSERRYHVAGALGAAFAKRLFELQWIRRLPSSRAVSITDEGKQALNDMLRLRL